MKCPNCQKELEEEVSFCPFCGKKTENEVKNDLRSIFSSSRFLAVCILVTVSVVLSFNSIFSVLFAISLWMIYADAASASRTVSSGGCKFLSVVWRVKYILMWVVAGIVAVAGVVGTLIILISRPFAAALLGGAVEYSADISETLSELAALAANALTSVPVTVLAALAVLIIAVGSAAVICVYNGFITRHFVRYFSGVSLAAKKGDKELETLDHAGASVRMIICGVLAAIPGIFNTSRIMLQNGHLHLKLSAVGGVGVLCVSAAYFIGYTLIKEYMSSHSKA